MKLVEANSLNLLAKECIIKLLGSQGYATYANRFKDLDFYVADFYKGSYCRVAFMSPTDKCIVINPGFCVDMTSFGPIFSQLSVIVRHELLHFLLKHEKRFLDYLKKTDKSFKQTYQRADMHTIANFAMDYELGNYGYDEYDKKVVRAMTLNGEVIGGLLAEEVKNSTTKVYGNGIIGVETYTGDQFNNWEDKSMEDMFQMLRDAHEKIIAEDPSKDYTKRRKPKLIIKKATHSQEYTDVYNEIMKKFDNKNVSDQELDTLLKRVMNGEDILSSKGGQA